MAWSNRIIPVLDDAVVNPDVDRPAMLLDVLSERGVEVKHRDIADLGAGFGSLAMGCVRRAARSVTAYDVNQERLTELDRRAASAGLPLETVQLNLLDGAPRPESVDIAFMIGVVEYAGLWDPNRNAEALQVQVLRTAWETLRPGGLLVLGTKNRLWPKWIFSETHTGQPMVALLPYALADKLSYRLSGEPYRHRIHTRTEWTNLLEHAGFHRVKSYVPYFSYWYPLALVEQSSYSDRHHIAVRLSEDPSLRKLTGASKLKLALSSTANRFHLTVSPGLVFIAQK